MKFRAGDLVVTVCPIYGANQKHQVKGFTRLPTGVRGTIEALCDSENCVEFYLVRVACDGKKYWVRGAETVFSAVEKEFA